MPIIDDVCLPLDYVSIAGPAVDALARRKENSSNPRIGASELRDSYHNVREELFAGIQALVRAVPVAGRSGGQE